MELFKRIQETIRFKKLENRIYKLKGKDLQLGIQILGICYHDEVINGRYKLYQLKNRNDSIEEILESLGA